VKAKKWCISGSMFNILCQCHAQFCCLVSWQQNSLCRRYIRTYLQVQSRMAHNGAKAGFITTPVAQSSSIRVCRFIFLAMLVCLVAVSYYCWTTTVNNSMLRDRVDRLSRDFSLTRNQHFAAEKNLAECKTRVSGECHDTV